ncbi:MAG: porphobilinogen synthase [Armatimonadota bacterium]|nr:porphobilinogen synthase [Armatimonadota bacterium]MCX7776738.1 porphobilinogen synthase [Armatimonadota bacterium]MDW8025807.1 porphobilinogen synthase [Armatimonadota bacterium]
MEMGFPTVRMRRMRRNKLIRRMVRETHLSVDDFVYPMFVQHGDGIVQEVPSMPGVYRYSVDMLLKAVEEVIELGIPAILLFGIPEHKDEFASEAYAEDGIVQTAVRQIKGSFGGDIVVITDVCLCGYTSHGHCGIVSEDGTVLNDATLDVLVKVALSHAAAGADIVAPSDMMDGRIKAIRSALDGDGFENVLIMSYAAKMASSFYGPFREAAESAPQFGDRRSYQMDYANRREAMRELSLDIEEGADIVMIKPALAYLDVIHQARNLFDVPIAAYNVSGEYAMVKAAAMNGWLSEKDIAIEILTAIKRAGADIIITYFAKDAASWLSER